MITIATDLPDISALASTQHVTLYHDVDHLMPSSIMEIVAPDFSFNYLPSTEAHEETMEQDTASFSMENLNAWEADPFSAPLLENLRAQTGNEFSAIVDQVSHLLAEKLVENTGVQSQELTMHEITDMRTLVAVSRRGESMGRHRRELAETLTIGSLINLDNPAWSPADMTTYTSVLGNNNVLLDLLQLSKQKKETSA